MIDGGENVVSQVWNLEDDLGGGGVVLGRCGNRDAIDFGTAAVIGLYPGRYVENLIVEDANAGTC